MPINFSSQLNLKKMDVDTAKIIWNGMTFLWYTVHDNRWREPGKTRGYVKTDTDNHRTANRILSKQINKKENVLTDKERIKEARIGSGAASCHR